MWGVADIHHHSNYTDSIWTNTFYYINDATFQGGINEPESVQRFTADVVMSHSTGPRTTALHSVLILSDLNWSAIVTHFPPSKSTYGFMCEHCFMNTLKCDHSSNSPCHCQMYQAQAGLSACLELLFHSWTHIFGILLQSAQTRLMYDRS